MNPRRRRRGSSSSSSSASSAAADGRRGPRPDPPGRRRDRGVTARRRAAAARGGGSASAAARAPRPRRRRPACRRARRRRLTVRARCAGRDAATSHACGSGGLLGRGAASRVARRPARRSGVGGVGRGAGGGSPPPCARAPRGAAARGGAPRRPDPARVACSAWVAACPSVPVGSFSSVTGSLPSAPGAGHTVSGAARGGRVMPSPGATESRIGTASGRDPPYVRRGASAADGVPIGGQRVGHRAVRLVEWPLRQPRHHGGDGGARSATARRAARTSSGRTAGVACRTTTCSIAHRALRT
jgi:hypothetical protein